ncbi:MAG: hypothetical protein WKG07_18600 [Hymenobacter sp.]
MTPEAKAKARAAEKARHKGLSLKAADPTPTRPPTPPTQPPPTRRRKPCRTANCPKAPA